MKLKVDYCMRILPMLMLLFAAQLAIGQRTVSGTVTDAETGEPLIGANILAIGTSTGTVTDFDGAYVLDIPEGITELEFTYTGYAAERVTIGASNTVDVSLSAGEVLDEVVVIGYGSVKKSDLTGSVASIAEKDFNGGLVVAPDQLIQGKAPGVQILNNSGQPGSATTVRIRGNASIRAGNDPLFVVDGVPLSGISSKPDLNAGGLGNTPPSNPLNYLNPDDIQSMEVLKDASAAAIYGSRGANGVIIINTKQGRTGPPTIGINTSIGFSNQLKKYEVLDGDEYRDALQDYGLTGGDFGDDVDAFDEITRTAVVNRHTLSINGGGVNGNYRASFGFFNQQGIVKNNDLQRINGTLSGRYKFLKNRRLGIDFNLIVSRTDESTPPISTDAGFRGSLIGNALQWNPTHPLRDSNGDPIPIPDFGNFTNPLVLLSSWNDDVRTNDVLFNIQPSYQITDNLTYRFLYGLNSGVGNRRFYIDKDINLENIEGRGQAAAIDNVVTAQVLTHTLTFDKDFGSTSFQALAGYEFQKTTQDLTGLVAQDFLVDDFDYTNILQNSSTNSRNVFSFAPPDQELQSFFGRVNFNFSDRFLLTATVRADGSSKFGENNRYGVFPAFAGAWNIHNEGFADDGIFDNLKLRVGWGQTGNQSFPPGASRERYGFGQEQIFLENVANPDLQWETTTTFNAGIDFALWDYKLVGSVEYFNRNTEDLLFQFPTIQPAPSSLYWINLPGNVINQGVEIALDAYIVDNPGFTWRLGGNVAFLDNELTNYDGPNTPYGTLFGQGISGAQIHRLANNTPLNAFYTRDHIEIGDDGQSVFANNEELDYRGDPNPDVLLGINTTFGVGDFNLTLNFNGSLGNDIYNNTKNTVIPIGNLGSRNIDANLVGNSVMEATSNPIKSSDRYIEDGSYVKLANATLTYDLGNIANNFLKGTQLYITGQNLFVITGYTGFDPEVNTVNDANGLPSAGIEYIPYPSARTVIFGARFNL